MQLLYRLWRIGMNAYFLDNKRMMYWVSVIQLSAILLLIGHIGYYAWILFSMALDMRVTPRLKDLDLSNLHGNPTLDIVIPARNEDRKIRRCLESLQAQTFSNFKVWQVDDRSTDRTGAIMAEFAETDNRFRVIQGIEPPSGWVGKVNAIAQAIPHLQSEYHLFLDADTALHPETLIRALTTMQRDTIGMLTLFPYLETLSFWERVVLHPVIMLISVTYPSRKVNNPNDPTALANGQFLLFEKHAYQQIGTHHAVSGSMVEDLNLAQRAKQLGLRFRMMEAQDYFTVRMYTNLPEIAEGWTKNMHFAEPDLPGWMLYGRVIGLWLLGTLPIITLLVSWWMQDRQILLVSLHAWLAMTCLIALSRYQYRMHPIYAVFHPLAMVMVGWFLFQSRRLALSTGVIWKGRFYK